MNSDLSKQRRPRSRITRKRTSSRTNLSTHNNSFFFFFQIRQRGRARGKCTLESEEAFRLLLPRLPEKMVSGRRPRWGNARARSSLGLLPSVGQSAESRNLARRRFARPKAVREKARARARPPSSREARSTPNAQHCTCTPASGLYFCPPIGPDKLSVRGNAGSKFQSQVPTLTPPCQLL